MNENQPQQFNILAFVKQYWLLLSFIVALITTWSSIINRVEALEVFRNKQEGNNESLQGLLISIQKDIVEVKTVLKIKDQSNN